MMVQYEPKHVVGKAILMSTVFSGILVMGVRLTSHWTAAAFTGLLFVSEWEWVSERKRYFFNFRKCGAHGGMILTGENRRPRRKTCPSATLSTTNPTGLTRARNRAAAVKGRWLTAWAMARPSTVLSQEAVIQTFIRHSMNPNTVRSRPIRILNTKRRETPSRCNTEASNVR
jgi:hypothetical protein